MSAPKNHQSLPVETADDTWRVLYLIGGLAAVVAVLVFRRYFSVELLQFNGFGLINVPDDWPASATGWFALFQENKLAGLLLFDLFDLVNYGLVGLIFLALYGALCAVNPGAMLLALVCGFVGIAVYFASNQTLAMSHLSDRFAAAATEVEQAAIMAAGEALLAIHTQGAGMLLSLFLVLLAGLVISIVMWRSAVFNKVTAIAGILYNGIGLGYFMALPFTPEFIWIFPTFSAPFRVIWYILIAFKLFQLARVKA
jgi:hypothetical protein